MAVVPYRQWRLPTRDEVRAVPTMAWVYAAVAIAALAIALVVDPRYNVSVVFGALEFIAPAAFAAAIAYVAPQPGLARIAAACFAIPVAIHAVAEAFLVGPIGDIGTDGSEWANLIPTINEWLSTVSSFVWLLNLVAVFALAAYVGRVHSRLGWVVFVIAATVALVRFAVAANDVANQVGQMGLMIAETPVQLLISPLSAAVAIGWAYLLAVAIERRYALLATAAGAQIVLSLLGILTVTVLSDWFQSASEAGSTAFAVFLFVTAALDFTFVIAMFFGILRELPRHGPSPETDQDVGQPGVAASASQ